MARVGSPDALKPVLPPLTRYKRDVALKLQNVPSNGSTRPATLPHDRCCPTHETITTSLLVKGVGGLGFVEKCLGLKGAFIVILFRGESNGRSFRVKGR